MYASWEIMSMYSFDSHMKYRLISNFSHSERSDISYLTIKSVRQHLSGCEEQENFFKFNLL